MLGKLEKRIRRKSRVRSKIFWTSSRPRMAIFRSNKWIYVQIINDETSETLFSSSDLKVEDNLTKIERAEKVWEDIAKKAIEKDIKSVVFDRAWFLYHWRVKALAEASRKAWLVF